MALDQTSASRLPGEVDCLVLGGGISGAGVARDAAIRGYRVMLVEAADFASGTSHVTSKVVHGGLRYLEHGHIRPVVENLRERYRLLQRMAPTLVTPLKFVLPFEGRRLAKWMATVCGLQAYGLPEWYRCGRTSTPMLGVRLRRDYPLMKRFPFAVTFWDAQTNDSRLVLSTLKAAQSHGAVVLNNTTVEGVVRSGKAWDVSLRRGGGGDPVRVRCAAVINATGPWAPETSRLLGARAVPLRWLKGSHLVLRRPATFGPDAIVMHSVRDRRPLWAIPWADCVIVGSTEVAFEGDLRRVHASVDEVADLFETFQETFPGRRFTRADIMSAYAGVRPVLPVEGQSDNALSREHRIDVDADGRLITLLGGKLTTFRRMAEQAMDSVDAMLEREPPSSSTRQELRTGGLWPGLSLEMARRLRANFTSVFDQRHISRGQIRHLVNLYGWDASLILEEMARVVSSSVPIAGSPYCLAELTYLARTEWVGGLLDLLRRRTPLYFTSDVCASPALGRIAVHIGRALGWSPDRVDREVADVQRTYRADLEAVDEYLGAGESLPAADGRVRVRIG